VRLSIVALPTSCQFRRSLSLDPTFSSCLAAESRRALGRCSDRGGLIIIPTLTLFAAWICGMHGASLVSVIATSSGAAATYVRDRMSLRCMFLELATTTGGRALRWRCLCTAVTDSGLCWRTPAGHLPLAWDETPSPGSPWRRVALQARTSTRRWTEVEYSHAIRRLARDVGAGLMSDCWASRGCSR